jgi:undecaprenol kinase
MIPVSSEASSKEGLKVAPGSNQWRGWVKCRTQSFVHAGRGILLLWLTQANFRIHLIAGLGAICLGWYFQILAIEWLALIVAIGLVLSAEALNTAIERMVDRIEPQRHPAARDAKDLAAAGVLLASVCSFIVGVILFGPRLVSEASRFVSGH